jgi:hypothetical protein
MSNGHFFISILAKVWHGISGHERPIPVARNADSPDTHLQEGSPHVNVDGAPMLNSVVDVLGKFYGDSGSSSTDNSVTFDPGTHDSHW